MFNMENQSKFKIKPKTGPNISAGESISKYTSLLKINSKMLWNYTSVL